MSCETRYCKGRIVGWVMGKYRCYRCMVGATVAYYKRSDA